MEPSTSPFYFFSPEQAHQQHIRQQYQQRQKQQQTHNVHYISHHHPAAAHALAAAAHSNQLVSPTPVSPVTFPSQLIFGAANSRSLAASGLTITPCASPSLYHHQQRSRQSSEITMPDTPRLSIDSSASELLFDPATPTLSLGSTNTPQMAHALLTPVGEHGWSMDEPSCGTISPMEIQLPGTPLDINANTDMSVYANPIIVPSNASPTPSAAMNNNNKHCPALTPSASQASSAPETDFCDPRNLTYPSPGHIDSSEFGIEFPTMPTLCGADDEHRLLLGNELLSFKSEEKGVKAYGIDFLEELSDLDSEDDFIRDIASISDVQSNQYNNNGKLETFDESEGCSSDDDSDQLMSPPMSASSSRQGSETPSELSHSELHHCSKKAKMEADDSDNEMSEEQHVRSFKFGSQGTPRREGASRQNGIPINPNVIRRGRKQSLTDDPTKTFVCHLCNRRFRRQEHLKRHFRSLHTEDKPFSCGECGKKFSRSDNLTQHARIHGQGAILLGVLDENEIIDRQFGLQDHEQQPLELVVVDALQAATGSKDINMSDEKRNKRNKRKRVDE